MELKEKLYLARVSKRLSLREVAKNIGVSAVCVSMYERGKSRPSKQTFKKLVEFYNVDFLNNLSDKNLYDKIDIKDLTEEEKAERKRQQMRKASKKYYEKHKEEIKKYYKEYNKRRKNGISRS